MDPQTHVVTEGFAGTQIPAIEVAIRAPFVVPSCNSGKTMVDKIVAELIGTNQVRQEGASVAPECKQRINDVVSYYVAQQLPIPILTPCGGRKTLCGFGADIAELYALKMICCIQRLVEAIYSPGLLVRIRLADTGAMHLFEDASNRDAVHEYVTCFTSLVRVLGYNYFVTPIPESTLMDEQEYAALADSYIPLLVAYIVESDKYGLDAYEQLASWKPLSEVGWYGSIPIEQRDYYRSRYRVLYPDLDTLQVTELLARYLTGSLARYKLGGTCVSDLDGRYIQITFMNPIPGAPPSMTWRNIYYRTLPSKVARTHIPFWRGKGYFRIQDGKICPKLASWNEKKTYKPAAITLSRQNLEVTIAADYIDKGGQR